MFRFSGQYWSAAVFVIAVLVLKVAEFSGVNNSVMEQTMANQINLDSISTGFLRFSCNCSRLFYSPDAG